MATKLERIFINRTFKIQFPQAILTKFVVIFLLSLIIGILVVNKVSILLFILFLFPLYFLILRKPYYGIIGLLVCFTIYNILPSILPQIFKIVPAGLGTMDVVLLIFTPPILIKFFVLASLKKTSFKLNTVDKLALIFIMFAFFAFLGSDNKMIAAGGFKQQIRVFLIYLLVRISHPKIQESKKLLKAIIAIGLIVASYGVYQYFFDPASYAIHAKATDHLWITMVKGEPSYRIYSLLLSPLGAGNVAMATIIILSSMYPIFKKYKWLNFVLVGITSLCLLFTYTRSAWMGCLAGLIVVGLFRKRHIFKIAFLLILVMISSLFVTKTITFLRHGEGIFFTAGLHYHTFIESFNYLLQHPLSFGLGEASFSVFEFREPIIWTENWFFYVWAELSIFGAILFVTVLVIFAKICIRLLRQPDDNFSKNITLATLACLVGYAVSGSFGMMWGDWVNSAFFGIMMGIVSTISEKKLMPLFPIRMRENSQSTSP